ncbi:MAG TPA: AAA family ATPase [Candidatus Binataceae bacterium]|nr:AAA family ATPase [Candidatus Binataceae bacterium]
MRCPKCGNDNRDGAKFCSECATPFSAKCRQCGADNSPGAKFCDECGTSLNAPDRASAAEAPRVPAPEVAGERRHLTILFCDLVGSVTLTARLDPEEWRATVAGYQRAAAEAITRFGGEVVRYVGDGIMAFFGYPVAHDNDAERAARAALAILDAIAQLNEQPAHTKLAVRIGIDSGRVVVGTGTGNAVDAFGDAANIAARVQAAAEPGSVMISEATQRLVAGLFIVEDRGAHTLKGVAQPVRLYRVIRPSGARGRFEAATAAGGLTSFVGREDELHSLMSRWERVLEGEGQVVTIIGEAGIGKSRLVQRFHGQIAETPHTWIDSGAGAFFQNTPFYTITEMLRRLIGDAPDQIAQLEGRLTAAGIKAAEAIPLIAPLLNLSLPPEYPPSALSPEQQRRRLLATLVEWVLGSARTQPLVIATEDLHWADPSTLELIQLLVEQGASVRLLLLYTARPEFRAQWPQRAHHTQIMLNRMNARDIRAMIARVAAAKALSDETITTVIERTGGVPLFVEELTRAVLESGDPKLAGGAIPATLHDSLMARLDRLGPAKEVIQVGAVIGSDFSYELLHAVHPIAEAELQRALRSLTDAELLYVRGIAPEATYQFKHALIRDAAYEALLKTRRKELHLIVARTIDEQFPALKESHPEVLARHWREAGETEPAIAEWQRAGERAVERRAYREAEQHYREAIGALLTLPESSERDARELTLQVALGEMMGTTRGWPAAETAQAYARARILAERGGGASLELFTGLYRALATRGEHRAALALADQMLEIAHSSDSVLALVAAHYAQALPRQWLGDLVGAREHLLQFMERYREEESRGKPDDPWVNSHIFAGQNEWFLGYPDRAARYVDESISIARRQNNHFATAFALSVGSWVYELRGDYRRSLEAGEAAVQIATASGSGFPFIEAMGKMRSARARAQMGDTRNAAAQIQEGLGELDHMRFYAFRASWLVSLGETQAFAGAVDEALVTVEQALQTNPEELFYRPEVFRLRGDLRVRSDSSKARFEFAEQDFREAIGLARGMEAKSLELRAITSLARLLRDTDRRGEARGMLAEIYNWFTEGFDTADLKDAKALLDELSVGGGAH